MRYFSNISIMDVPHGFLFLNENLKMKIQNPQNKCIYFCLNLHSESHIDPPHFRKISCLSASDRVEDCIAHTVFNYWYGIAPEYIPEMLKKPSLCRYGT